MDKEIITPGETKRTKRKLTQDDKKGVHLVNMMVTRTAKGITKKELAIRALTTEAQIGRIENGIQLPKIDTAIEVSLALGISLDDMFKDLIEHIKSNKK